MGERCDPQSCQVPGVPWFQKKGKPILQNRWRRIWGWGGRRRGITFKGQMLSEGMALYTQIAVADGGGLQTCTEGGLYEYKTWELEIVGRVSGFQKLQNHLGLS